MVSMKGLCQAMVWGYTPKIDSMTLPFLKFNTATGYFLKFDMRHGHLSDTQQGYSLNSTGKIRLKIFSTMRQDYF